MHPIRDLKTPDLLRPFEVIIWGESKDQPLYRWHVMAFSDGEAKEDAIRRCISPCDAPLRITRIDVCDGVRVTPHQRQRGLFEDLCDVCLGSSVSEIQGAVINVLLATVQRTSPKLADAEARWDEMMGRGKLALQRRYAAPATPGVVNAEKAEAAEIGARLGG
jgi:hypothetical protein